MLLFLFWQMYILHNTIRVKRIRIRWVIESVVSVIQQIGLVNCDTFFIVYCSMASISSMPSASLISSTQLPSSGTIIQATLEKSMAAPVLDANLCGEGPLGQALQVVEKKVRNLEKRKVSLLEHHKEQVSTLHHILLFWLLRL